MFRIILFASIASVAAAEYDTPQCEDLPKGTEIANSCNGDSSDYFNDDCCLYDGILVFPCAIQCSEGFIGSSQGSLVDQIFVICTANGLEGDGAQFSAQFSDWECTATTAFVCSTTAFDDFTNHDTSACETTVRN